MQLAQAITDILTFLVFHVWLGSRVVSVLDSVTEGPGSSRNLDASTVR